jgi:ERCC4-related helicase
MNDVLCWPDSLLLGKKFNKRVREADQTRQRREVEEIVKRLSCRPGVILADEVGMGKTFVALAAAYAFAETRKKGPVVIMIPSGLVDKWLSDLRTFCELYVDNRPPIDRFDKEFNSIDRRRNIIFAVAKNPTQFFRLFDDDLRHRCHFVFLTHGAMNSSQNDPYVRLALLRETFRRYNGKRENIGKVKNQIHRFLGVLLRGSKGIMKTSVLQEELWQKLLSVPPDNWRQIINKNMKEGRPLLSDDPVPTAFIDSFKSLGLEAVADAIEKMPIRATGGEERVSERIEQVRKALQVVERTLWAEVVRNARWRSPLLVLDEAHHLKNEEVILAKQLQDTDSATRMGDGALSKSFDRMLFLTATPFQLGHYELVNVLRRFQDVRWDAKALGQQDDFEKQLAALLSKLDSCQRASIELQRAWNRLEPQSFDGAGSPDDWWRGVMSRSLDELSVYERRVREAFEKAKSCYESADSLLKPWIIRHNKGTVWAETLITRRTRIDGCGIIDPVSIGGLSIPDTQLFPFYLAARSAVNPGKDILGEALCSSYEAFRHRRVAQDEGKDEVELIDTPIQVDIDEWLLKQFEIVVDRYSGMVHPKIDATVRKAVDLWAQGEKVLIFAFYRKTCAALRREISNEIERRLNIGEKENAHPNEIGKSIDIAHDRFFDKEGTPGRRALDNALEKIIDSCMLGETPPGVDRESLLKVMRRFLRVKTTLVRTFPLAEMNAITPEEAVDCMLSFRDSSHMSWHQKFIAFLNFLIQSCAEEGNRKQIIEACLNTQTGNIRVQIDDPKPSDMTADEHHEFEKTLANVQVITGDTKKEARARLMRAFNTPFFPDILVCSQVMGEGVDLHLFCSHVIHHDIDWNPCSIEQRTGRIDRLGCKAEGKQTIHVYLPYLAGTADERQYRVMRDREAWFQIVMGQDQVAKLVPRDQDNPNGPPPKIFQEALSFNLSIHKA